MSISVRGLSYVWKVVGLKERKYQSKDWQDKIAFKIDLVIEWGRLSVDTTEKPLITQWKTYIFPIGFRSFKFKDKTTWLEEVWTSYFLRTSEKFQEVV